MAQDGLIAIGKHRKSGQQLLLPPAAAQAYLLADAAMRKEKGHGILVNSTIRDSKEQAALYKAKKGKQAVAPPGHSTHELEVGKKRGAHGIDIDNFNEAKPYLAAQGFVWKNYSNDPWHFDFGPNAGKASSGPAPKQGGLAPQLQGFSAPAIPAAEPIDMSFLKDRNAYAASPSPLGDRNTFSQTPGAALQPIEGQDDAWKDVESYLQDSDEARSKAIGALKAQSQPAQPKDDVDSWVNDLVSIAPPKAEPTTTAQPTKKKSGYDHDAFGAVGQDILNTGKWLGGLVGQEVGSRVDALKPKIGAVGAALQNADLNQFGQSIGDLGQAINITNPGNVITKPWAQGAASETIKLAQGAASLPADVGNLIAGQEKYEPAINILPGVTEQLDAEASKAPISQFAGMATPYLLGEGALAAGLGSVKLAAAAPKLSAAFKAATSTPGRRIAGAAALNAGEALIRDPGQGTYQERALERGKQGLIGGALGGGLQGAIEVPGALKAIDLGNKNKAIEAYQEATKGFRPAPEAVANTRADLQSVLDKGLNKSPVNPLQIEEVLPQAKPIYHPQDPQYPQGARLPIEDPKFNQATEGFPKSSYGKTPLQFESDVDNALYIIGKQVTGSKGHGQMVSFVKRATGLDDTAVNTLAKNVRSQVNSAAEAGQFNQPALWRSALEKQQTPAPKVTYDLPKESPKLQLDSPRVGLSETIDLRSSALKTDPTLPKKTGTLDDFLDEQGRFTSPESKQQLMNALGTDDVSIVKHGKPVHRSFDIEGDEVGLNEVDRIINQNRPLQGNTWQDLLTDGSNGRTLEEIQALQDVTSNRGKLPTRAQVQIDMRTPNPVMLDEGQKVLDMLSENPKLLSRAQRDGLIDNLEHIRKMDGLTLSDKAVKQLDRARREALRTIELADTKGQIFKIRDELDSVHENVRTVARTKIDPETGIGQQRALPEGAMDLKEVIPYLSDEKQVQVAKILSKAMSAESRVATKYHANISGTANNLLEKDFTPLYFVKTQSNDVMVAGYNGTGHFREYYVTPKQGRGGSFSQIEDAFFTNNPAFRGPDANIVHGPRDYNVETILRRPPDAAKLNPTITTQEGLDWATRIREGLNMPEAANLHQTAREVLKRLENVGKLTVKDLQELDNIVKNDLNTLKVVCKILGF